MIGGDFLISGEWLTYVHVPGRSPLINLIHRHIEIYDEKSSCDRYINFILILNSWFLKIKSRRQIRRLYYYASVTVVYVAIITLSSE